MMLWRRGGAPRSSRRRRSERVNKWCYGFTGLVSDQLWGFFPAHSPEHLQGSSRRTSLHAIKEQLSKSRHDFDTCILMSLHTQQHSCRILQSTSLQHQKSNNDFNALDHCKFQQHWRQQCAPGTLEYDAGISPTCRRPTLHKLTLQAQARDTLFSGAAVG